MNSIRFSWLMLKRDWHAGEFRVLLLAVIITAASISSVGFFTDRIQQALKNQANELLAADLIVRADRKIRETLVNAAEEQGLEVAQFIEFPSMVSSGDRFQLAEVKAVSKGYPLRGSIRIAASLFGADKIATSPPLKGTVWLEAELFQRLKVKVGDSIILGDRAFTLAAVLVDEPDRGSSLFSIAPRLMLNLADVPSTQLITSASRVKFNLLVAGSSAAIKSYKNNQTPLLKKGERIIDVSDARPEIRQALKRAKRFLGLAVLVSVMLAGIAMAMAARRFVRRQWVNCAVLKCLGATQSQISKIYSFEMLWLGCMASCFGLALGYLAHLGLINILHYFVLVELPQPSLKPVITGFSIGLITLLTFTIPPLLRLKNVPTMLVFRKEITTFPAPALSAFIIGSIALLGLIFWQAEDVKLGSYIVLGFLATALVLFIFAFLLVRSIRVVNSRGQAAWRFGLANIARRANSSIVQVMAIGVGIMALLLLVVVEKDLLKGWRDKLPDETPNRFIINIHAHQLEQIQQKFKRENLIIPEIYPMVKGRLMTINGQPITEYPLNEHNKRRLVEREFNLSWAKHLPPDNELTEGSWWSDLEQFDHVEDNNKKDTNKFLSVEAGIAKTMGVKLGDILTFDIAGESMFAQVANIRTVHWDSFHVNFFIITSMHVLEKFPTTYVTSFYLPENRISILSQLIEQFPNITIIDVSTIMNKVRNIIQRVSTAVEYVFLFTLVSGFIVLFAAIQATQDERLQESAVLRALGASRRQLLMGMMSEFIALGVVAGIIASLAASLLGYVLAEVVLKVPYTFNYLLWVYGLLAGSVSVGIVGYLGTKSIVNHPPFKTLSSLP